jgi:iron(III) transport system ATP-binding protein
VMLLDEPFSSLDAPLRAGLRRDVAKILADAHTTTVLVTHDQDEVHALADRTVELCGGRVSRGSAPRP